MVEITCAKELPDRPCPPTKFCRAGLRRGFAGLATGQMVNIDKYASFVNTPKYDSLPREVTKTILCGPCNHKFIP